MHSRLRAAAGAALVAAQGVRAGETLPEHDAEVRADVLADAEQRRARAGAPEARRWRGAAPGARPRCAV
jgi:hypothetical protein